MVKSKRLKWASHLARMGYMRNAYKILVGNLKGREHFGNLDTDGSIILK
jgi:hypothetical protein